MLHHDVVVVRHHHICTLFVTVVMSYHICSSVLLLHLIPVCCHRVIEYTAVAARIRAETRCDEQHPDRTRTPPGGVEVLEDDSRQITRNLQYEYEQGYETGTSTRTLLEI